MKIFKKLTSAVSAFFIAGSVIALTGNTLKCHALEKRLINKNPFDQEREEEFEEFEDDYERAIPQGFISILGRTVYLEGAWYNNDSVERFVERAFFESPILEGPRPIFSDVNREGMNSDDIMEIILQEKGYGKFSFYPKTLKYDISTKYYDITGRQPNDFIANPADYGDNARFINIFRAVWGNNYRCDLSFKAQIDNVWKKQVFELLDRKFNDDPVKKIQLCMCIHDILADLKGEKLGLLNRLRWIKPDFKLDDVAPPEGVPALSLVDTQKGKNLQFTFRIKKADGKLTNNITRVF